MASISKPREAQTSRDICTASSMRRRHCDTKSQG
jgi:hypothetical protein